MHHQRASDHPGAGLPSGDVPGGRDELPSGLSPLFLEIWKRAAPYLDTRSNDSHARISCQYVLAFLRREGGDPEVAVPAILLHDLGWSAIPAAEQRRAYGPGSSDADLNRRHELEGARLAREILESVDYPRELTDEICRIILTHDSDPTARTVEEAIVKDADKVWRVSRAGFPVTMGLLDDMTPQQLHDFIAVRVPRWFLTVSGREAALADLAALRHDHGLEPAPDIPPPAGYGVGDAVEYGT